MCEGVNMKIGVMLLTGPYQYEASDSMVQFVEAAVKKGHEVVGIFLFMDGVYTMNKNVKPTGERNIVEMIDRLGEKIPVTACSACAQFRGMKKEFSSRNVKVGGLGDLMKIVRECDRFITFGG